MQPILYLLSRRSTNEPLIDEFLFGDYAARPYPPTTYAECLDGSTVAYSKNTAKVPKIIGNLNLAVPTDLMLDLRGRVTAKWRQVEVTEPFEFEWNSDGFEIIEQYENICRQELEASGVTDPYDQDEYILTDESLVYLDMIKRYRAETPSTDFNYWEMVVLNSYRSVETDNSCNVLIVSRTDERVSRVIGKCDRDAIRDNEWPLSIEGLIAHGIFSLYSGSYAIASSIMPKIETWVEPEYYSIRPIFDRDIDPY